jgi:hypothetical protein
MLILAAVSQAVLFIWFLGCTVTYKCKRFTLVDGMGLKSAEFVMLCLYSAGVALFWLFPFGKWVLLGILAFWFAVQFLCHWRYTLFGASEAKLRGYNECFEGTLRIFPKSDTRLVPDLYHIVLHALILLNIFLCVFYR